MTTTFYEPHIRTVESPLNEEMEVTESAHDYWPEFEPFPLLSIQQRMFMILIVATIFVIVFGLLIVPSTLLSFANAGASLSHTAVNPANQARPQIFEDTTDQISAIFSPEVHYWAPQIIEWAAAENLDPDMVATVMQIESCGDPDAVSSAGARGLFQVMPFHFANGENSMDPDTNARRGMAYLSDRLEQTNGNIGKAFAGYNGGHVAAGSEYNAWANETQRYFRWSTTIYADAQAGLNDSPALAEWLAAGGASLCNQAASRLRLR